MSEDLTPLQRDLLSALRAGPRSAARLAVELGLPGDMAAQSSLVRLERRGLVRRRPDLGVHPYPWEAIA